MTYTAPIDDMRFCLKHLAGLDTVRGLPGYEEFDEDLIDAVLEEAGKFGGEVLAPTNRVGDQQGSVYENGVVRTPEGFKEAWSQFVEGGWNGVPFDPDYGGQGLPMLVSTAVSEVWTSANMAFSLCPMLTQGAAELLHAHGSKELKQRVLPKMVSGEWTGTMNLTEPQAGSDLAKVRSRAIRSGDHYRISGQKIFITWGEHDMAENIVHMVLARVPDAPPGIRGISLFLVPKFVINEDGSLGPHNDLRCVSVEHKLGIKASPTAVMSFGDNEGAVGWLVGEENRGIEHMFLMMNNARLAVGLEGVGIGERAYQLARDFAFERVQGRNLGSSDPAPVSIAHHPDVQRMLLLMKSRTEAARALAYFTAASLDIARRHPDVGTRLEHDALVALLTPVVKAWSTDLGIETADLGIQIQGGMGYIEEGGAPQHLRDARIASIYEGTNGIQALDLVSRKVAREEGVTVKAFIERMRSLDAELVASGAEDLRVVAESLKMGLDDLSVASDWIIRTFDGDPRSASAGAVHYLHLLGSVAGGWLMAQAALDAAQALAQGEGDPRFLKAKRVSTRFYADHVLSRTGWLREAVTRSGDSLVDLDVDAVL